jgi:hypothetical protein
MQFQRLINTLIQNNQMDKNTLLITRIIKVSCPAYTTNFAKASLVKEGFGWHSCHGFCPAEAGQLPVGRDKSSRETGGSPGYFLTLGPIAGLSDCLKTFPEC